MTMPGTHTRRDTSCDCRGRAASVVSDRRVRRQCETWQARRSRGWGVRTVRPRMSVASWAETSRTCISGLSGASPSGGSLRSDSSTSAHASSSCVWGADERQRRGPGVAAKTPTAREGWPSHAARAPGCPQCIAQPPSALATRGSRQADAPGAQTCVGSSSAHPQAVRRRPAGPPAPPAASWAAGPRPGCPCTRWRRPPARGWAPRGSSGGSHQTCGGPGCGSRPPSGRPRPRRWPL